MQFLDALGHRNKILRLVNKSGVQDPQTARLTNPHAPPDEFLCPITQELIRDPVLCAGQSPLLLILWFIFC